MEITNPTANITIPVIISTTPSATDPIIIRIANGDATIKPIIAQYAIWLNFLNTNSTNFATATIPTTAPIIPTIKP